MGKEGCASISFEEDIVVAWSVLGVFSNLSIEIGTRKLAARWLQRECPDLSGPLFCPDQTSQTFKRMGVVVQSRAGR